MKIVKIKDKFMYKPKTARERAKYKPDGSHTYLVYSDRKTGEIRAIRTTHLYEDRKIKQIESGRLMVEKLPKVKYPSGIRNSYVSTDVTGRPLDLKKVKAVNYGGKNAVYIPTKKAKSIQRFANKKER